jgi:hypothetical protein
MEGEEANRERLEIMFGEGWSGDLVHGFHQSTGCHQISPQGTLASPDGTALVPELVSGDIFQHQPRHEKHCGFKESSFGDME